ncbi:MAG: YHS domain-containing protein, partial [Acinetobacter sp.]
MSEQHKTSCCSKQKLAPMVVNIDPVCGMTVAEDSPHVYEYQSVRYLFCCSGCLKKFAANPEAYLTSEKAPSTCCSKPKVDLAEASLQPQDGAMIAEPKSASDPEKTTFIDPVCGMTVTDLTKPHTEWQGHDYYFCSEKCLQKFIANPKAYIKDKRSDSVVKSSGCCGSTPKVIEKKASCCTPKPQIEPDTKASCCAPKPKAEAAKSSCCGGGKHEHSTQSESAEFIDPVCGMAVDPNTELKTDYQQQTYYFCNPSCLDKFKSDPEFYLIPPDQRPVPEGA